MDDNFPSLNKLYRFKIFSNNIICFILYIDIKTINITLYFIQFKYSLINMY